MPFEAGQSVGPYRIIEPLGQGGMATVYKAYHANLDRYVAIKVLHPALKDDDTFFIRFQREAQIVAKLEHPYIVPVYDFATQTDEPYIVMKFIEGQTLKHLLKRKHLTLEETLQILPPIAQALTYAHQRGVLHRDVKPSNIMLDADDMPYLADFGLARIASSGESTMSQDVLIGTPNYISPEQARGEKNLDAGTDIYSLGIILYEIVVGRVPFSGDTPYAIIHDHIYKPLPLPTQVNPTVPLQVERVLLKTLSKEPQDRYQSAVELVEAFQTAVREADMKELSAASVRLEQFTDGALTPSTPATNNNIDELVREAVSKALASQQLAATGSTPAAPPVPETAIPAVMPSYTPLPTSSVNRRRKRGSSRRLFWFLSGCGALIFTCIGSLWVFINALQNPIVQSNPALAETTTESTQSAEATQMSIEAVIPLLTDDLTIETLIEMQAEEPTNAAILLALSFRYLENGQFEIAQENLIAASKSPEASPDLFAEAARFTASEGFANEAIFLWAIAVELDPTNPEVRNDGGQYLYRQLTNLEPEILPSLLIYLNETFSSGVVRSMTAHTLLVTDSRNPELQQERIITLLDAAIENGDALAETYLVYGDYYTQIGDAESAREAWEFANSFVDTPTWVEREVNTRLNSSATATQTSINN